MIGFDFKSGTDEFGFVRLKNVKNVQKFIDIFRRMDSFYQTNPFENLYRDYSSSMYDSQFGDVPFRVIPEAEMFISRVFKHFPTGWIMWCGRGPMGLNRKKNIVYVYGFDYCNQRKYDMRTIIVKWYDVNRVHGRFEVNINEIEDVVFKVLTDEEVNTVKNLMKIFEQKPSPIYRLMNMKEDYQKDYDLYLEDCKKYGFQPLEKCLIERLTVKHQGFVTTLTEDGVLGGQFCPEDVLIVNE